METTKKAFKETAGLKQALESIRTAGAVSLAQEQAHAVSARTNGRFELKIFTAGELFSIPRPHEALEKAAIEMEYDPP